MCTHKLGNMKVGQLLIFGYYDYTRCKDVKAQRDPIRDMLTTDYLKAKSITLGKIWKSEIVEDPAVKRALKKAGIDQDSEFKDDADLGADLTGIGF